MHFSPHNHKFACENFIDWNSSGLDEKEKRQKNMSFFCFSLFLQQKIEVFSTDSFLFQDKVDT